MLWTTWEGLDELLFPLSELEIEELREGADMLL